MGREHLPRKQYVRGSNLIRATSFSFPIGMKMLMLLVLPCIVSMYIIVVVIESVDSISRDERGFPLTQYITNGGISRARYTITHFKHDHRVLRLISNRMSI